MKNIHVWKNYVNGKEHGDKIVLYAGKTRQSLDARSRGVCAKGVFQGGLNAWKFENIHCYQQNTTTRNDKFTEQLHINTVRLVAQAFPEFVVCGNTNDDAYYGPIVGGYSQPVFDKIIAWIKGTRLMTEKRMKANQRKLSRKLAQMKSKRAAVKAAVCASQYPNRGEGNLPS